MKFPRKDLTPKQVTDIIEENITEKTKVLSLMDVCTITGMRMPMKEVAAIAEQKEILLVCDGAQSAGMMNVDVREMGVDTFATSGHKWLMGPKETGFVYIIIHVMRMNPY